MLGAAAWWPLADLATSRGRGAGGTAAPEEFAPADEATIISLIGLINFTIEQTFVAIAFASRSRRRASLCQEVFCYRHGLEGDGFLDGIRADMVKAFRYVFGYGV